MSSNVFSFTTGNCNWISLFKIIAFMEKKKCFIHSVFSMKVKPKPSMYHFIRISNNSEIKQLRCYAWMCKCFRFRDTVFYSKVMWPLCPSTLAIPQPIVLSDKQCSWNAWHFDDLFSQKKKKAERKSEGRKKIKNVLLHPTCLGGCQHLASAFEQN